jgi:signal transduction histidine kinase
MVDEQPDPERFAETVGRVVDQARAAAGPHGRVVAFGEMVALLYTEGNVAAAIRLEQLWNELGATCDFQLHCAYPMHLFTREADGSSMEAICAEHSRVAPTETYTALTSDARRSAIALLQQKAQVLEWEVAQRKRAEEELAQRNRELADAVAARDAFLSIAAHELKTPLTGVRLSAQLVQRLLKSDGAGVSHISPALDRLDAQTAKLGRLIEQLLDISRLQQGQLVLEPAEADVCAVVQTVVDTARAAAPEREIRLETPEVLIATIDPLRLEQVVTNLVDNAVKYSPDGGVVNVELTQQDADTIQLTVRDHGIGIDPSFRERIFEPFYRVPRANHPSGMGLGLHITRQIVELHGGRVETEFPEDAGTRFVVTLPIHRATTAAPAA